MPFIYKVTNQINQKTYIGQTINSVQGRWAEHIRRTKSDNFNTGFHGAIIKYGYENFIVDTICQCEKEELNPLEIKYIVEYQSHLPEKGYNLNLGGDGSWIYDIDEQELIDNYSLLMSYQKVSSLYGCSDKTIAKRLKGLGIGKLSSELEEETRKSNLQKGVNAKKKKVYCLEKDISFESIADACRWLQSNNFSTAKTIKSGNLTRTIDSQTRLTYCGFHWKYI